jgi:hypothetical protein
LITPTRRFIKEGELSYYGKKGKSRSGYYFLFNDVFLYTTKKGSNKYLLKAFATLDQAILRYVMMNGMLLLYLYNGIDSMMILIYYD